MKKILIADDSPAWRGFHKKFLEEIFIEPDIDEKNIQTDFVISANEGYNLAIQNKNAPYDLIITDLQMEEDFYPKTAGEWFIEQIKTLNDYVNTKIIICSGSSYIKHISEEYNVDYIPKRVAVADINKYKDIIISYLK